MGTFGDMQDRIADELRRSDLTARIPKAIVSAVEHYAGHKFWFCETSFTFPTVAGQEYYDSSDDPAIATSSSIDQINGLFNGTRTPITKRPFEYIDRISTLTTSQGQPFDWAYREQNIRFYPIPDAAYTITAFDVPRLTELSADADTNAWTNEAEELIRLHSKRDLIMNLIGITGREKEYSEMGAAEERAVNRLAAETRKRKATGMIQPTRF